MFETTPKARIISSFLEDTLADDDEEKGKLVSPITSVLHGQSREVDEGHSLRSKVCDDLGHKALESFIQDQIEGKEDLHYESHKLSEHFPHANQANILPPPSSSSSLLLLLFYFFIISMFQPHPHAGPPQGYRRAEMRVV